MFRDLGLRLWHSLCGTAHVGLGVLAIVWARYESENMLTTLYKGSTTVDMSELLGVADGTVEDHSNMHCSNMLRSGAYHIPHIVCH